MKDLAFGGFGAIPRIMKIAKDDSIWVLKKAERTASQQDVSS
jgi:hypothetical protein